MADLKTTLHDIAAAIVDTPEEVKVTMDDDDREINLVLSVAADDLGMVIGKHGKIARAIRMVVKAAANRQDKHVSVEIL